MGTAASQNASSINTRLEQVSAMLETPGRTHLVGNSFGGVLALLQASRYPSRIARLIIFGAPTPTTPDRSWNPVNLGKRYLIAVPGSLH